MKKVISIFNKIGIDKFKHFCLGFFIYFLFSFISTLIGLTVVFIIAAGKEIIYDKIMKKGTPEFLDFIFTITPGLILYLQTLIK